MDERPFALLMKTLKTFFSSFVGMKNGKIVPDIGLDIVPDIYHDSVYKIMFDIVLSELEKGSM